MSANSTHVAVTVNDPEYTDAPYTERLGPGRDHEHAARLIGDADLGHRVYREVDRCPVGHLHHAYGK